LTDPARAWLHDRTNPFDGLVRPQRPDEHFLDHHEPSIHQAEYQLLAAAVDVYRPLSYRLKPYQPGGGLADSRVITVFGPRGAGKTHLLEALAHRTDASQLLIRPTAFDLTVPFDEALAGHLITALRAGGAQSGRPPLRDIAANVTARLLRRALGVSVPGEPLPAEAPVALAQAHGLTPAEAVDRVAEGLRRWEPESVESVRRRLLVELACGALLDEADPLGTFVESGGGRLSLSGEAARQLLLALVEVCALVRLPVVVAYDNLEGLLAPQG
jgi:hypothetical protein